MRNTELFYGHNQIGTDETEINQLPAHEKAGGGEEKDFIEDVDSEDENEFIEEDDLEDEEDYEEDVPWNIGMSKDEARIELISELAGFVYDDIVELINDPPILADEIHDAAHELCARMFKRMRHINEWLVDDYPDED